LYAFGTGNDIASILRTRPEGGNLKSVDIKDIMYRDISWLNKVNFDVYNKDGYVLTPDDRNNNILCYKYNMGIREWNRKKDSKIGRITNCWSRLINDGDNVLDM